MRLPTLLLLTVTLGWCRAATFTFQHFGTPANAQAAIQHAADIWGDILVSDVPIKVSVSWTPLGSAALGITFPNGRKDFNGAPVAATWYASALANSIAGTELNPGEDDINIYLNSGTNWYYGLDGNTPAAQYDLVSIALHELGHGLGFVGLAKKVGSEGSFGTLQASDFAPLITTFPWPQQDTLPGIFDRFLTSTANGPLVDVANPSTTLGAAFTSNQVHFNGPNATEANGGQTARIYAPATFALGSSCVHFNEATFPVGNENELMTPFSAAGESNHWPGSVCIGVMRDIGWSIAPDVAISEREPALIEVGPNPCLDLLWVRSHEPLKAARITDLHGRTVIANATGSTVDVTALAPGNYLFFPANGAVPVRFVKEH